MTWRRRRCSCRSSRRSSMLARPPLWRSTRPACSPLSRPSTRYEKQRQGVEMVVCRAENLQAPVCCSVLLLSPRRSLFHPAAQEALLLFSPFFQTLGIYPFVTPFSFNGKWQGCCRRWWRCRRRGLGFRSFSVTGRRG